MNDFCTSITLFLQEQIQNVVVLTAIVYENREEFRTQQKI